LFVERVLSSEKRGVRVSLDFSDEEGEDAD